LVRLLCNKCKEAYTPPPEVIARYGLAGPDEPAPTIYRAKGCDACNNIGYKGRIGLFEIMPMEDDLKTLVVKSASADAIKRTAVGLGMLTLQNDGVAKVLAGMTSLEEMLRVVFVE
jgi:type IV pilus assembly protein PilB